MEILKNLFVEITIDKTTNILIAKWLPETEKMSTSEFKSTFLEIAAIIFKNNIRLWLGDTTDFRMPIIPELQKWTADELNPRLVNAGLMKMAILIPQEFIGQISVEQSVEEMDARNLRNQFLVKYFDNIKDANAWLLKIN
jgi:hypothetical protein